MGKNITAKRANLLTHALSPPLPLHSSVTHSTRCPRPGATIRPVVASKRASTFLSYPCPLYYAEWGRIRQLGTHKVTAAVADL